MQLLKGDQDEIKNRHKTEREQLHRKFRGGRPPRNDEGLQQSSTGIASLEDLPVPAEEDTDESKFAERGARLFRNGPFVAKRPKELHPKQNSPLSKNKGDGKFINDNQL